MSIDKLRSYLIAFVATMVRYYDYSLFGLSAAVISRQLMPSGDFDSKLKAFYLLFSLSVLLRPVGSLIFGKIGDKYGRVVSVKIAALLAAISTFLVAFIPSYQSVGFWSVILLFIVRVMFLMSFAGEIDAVKIYIAEMVGKKHRFLASSMVTFSSQIGVLIAALFYHFGMRSSDPEIYWRYNFIAGGVVGVFIFLFREKLVESEFFQRVKNSKHDFDHLNILQIIQKNISRFIVAIILYGMLGGIYHFLIIFLAIFASNSAGILSPEFAEILNIKLIIIYGISTVISGLIADRCSCLKQVMIGIILTLCVSLVMQFSIYNNSKSYPILIHEFLVMFVPLFMVPIQVTIQSLFPTKIKMRMCSLAHSIGSMIFSSTTPVISMIIWKNAGSFEVVICYFMLQIILILLSISWINYKNYSTETDN